MKSTTTLAVVPVLLLAILSSAPKAAAFAVSGTIEQVCMSGATSKFIHVDYAFCVASLNDALREKRLPPPTTVDDVALLSMQVVLANATKVEAYIEHTLANASANGNLTCRSCVEYCRDVYAKAVRDSGDTLKALEEGKLNEAYRVIYRVADTAALCDGKFYDMPVERMFSDYDKDFERLTATSVFALYTLALPH